MVHVANQFIDPLLGELVVGDAIELTNCFLGVVARGDLVLSVSGVAVSAYVLICRNKYRLICRSVPAD